ncbi:MAG TPA: hypothetical protein VD997_16815 [Phycisphaerales bacterium]|nr:hypothetical protein [Phycisphaerales bacterium]
MRVRARRAVRCGLPDLARVAPWRGRRERRGWLVALGVLLMLLALGQTLLYNSELVRRFKPQWVTLESVLVRDARADSRSAMDPPT